MKFRLFLMLLSDALLAVAALCTAVTLRLGLEALLQECHEGKALRIGTLFVAVSLFSSYLMELYSLVRGSSKWEIFIRCLQCGCASFFFLSVVYYLHPSVMLSRGVLFISLALFCLYQYLWHVVSISGKDRSPFAKRVLILGADKLALELGELVTAGNVCVLAGLLEFTADKERLDAALPLPDSEPCRMVALQGDLLSTACNEKVDIIVVALPERRGILPLQEIMQCKLNGIEVLNAADFYEILQGKLMLEQMTPNWMIFSSGLRRTTLVTFLKRCIDIALSLAVLILALPLFPLVALAIKLDSTGPLFFKQIRIGDSEKPFFLYRFRSLSTAERSEHGESAATAIQGGPQVTRLARFLNKSGIEGIPKLYNVLKGDMSLIGPRPERPEFVAMLKKDIYYYSKRHTIKPGLTGWAQVRHGHGSTVNDALEKLRYDLYYVKNLSLSLDSQIMFETMKVALFGRGSQ